MPTLQAIFTGTINPQVATPGTLVDPREREREYIEAMSFNAQRLAALSDKITLVFAENSEWKSQRLADCLSNYRINLVRCKSSDESKIRGKGYSEVELIRQTLECMTLSDQFIKITGRLKIDNIYDIASGIINGRKCAARANLCRRLEYADCRCYSFTREFFRAQILSQLPLIDDRKRHWVEFALARALRNAARAGEPVSSLPLLPEFIGRSGATGKRYGRRSLLEKTRFKLYATIVVPAWAKAMRAFEGNAR